MKRKSKKKRAVKHVVVAHVAPTQVAELHDTARESKEPLVLVALPKTTWQKVVEWLSGSD